MSLFAGTLIASFVVVGLPHLFPCPAPRRTFADSEMRTTADGQQIQRIRRRRRQEENTRELKGQEPPAATEEEVDSFLELQQEAHRLANSRRECPVPKPRGKLGEMLGFKSPGDEQQQQQTGSTGFPQSDLSGREN